NQTINRPSREPTKKRGSYGGRPKRIFGIEAIQGGAERAAQRKVCEAGTRIPESKGQMERPGVHERSRVSVRRPYARSNEPPLRQTVRGNKGASPAAARN